MVLSACLWVIINTSISNYSEGNLASFSIICIVSYLSYLAYVCHLTFRISGKILGLISGPYVAIEPTSILQKE